MIILRTLNHYDIDNYQGNDNSNEHINGSRLLIDEEVYDKIGIGRW